MLRVLKGEKSTAVADDLNVSVPRLERWEERFITAGTEALTHKSRRSHLQWREKWHSIAQWVGLLVALVALILLLLRFFEREPGA